MSVYIKLSTGEYPRHIGDIEIDPAGIDDYAYVEWVDPPTIDWKTQRCLEGLPLSVNGLWKMTWIVRDITYEEIKAVEEANDQKHY
jgi:hypothetical protein